MGLDSVVQNTDVIQIANKRTFNAWTWFYLFLNIVFGIFLFSVLRAVSPILGKMNGIAEAFSLAFGE